MTIKRLATIFIISGLTLGTSSCALLGFNQSNSITPQIKDTTTSSTEAKTETSVVSTPSTSHNAQASEVETAFKTNNGVKKDTKLNKDKTSSKKETASKSTTDKETAYKNTHSKNKKSNTATIDDISGEWYITSVGSKAIRQDDNMPYLNFVPAEGRFYGSNGCNVLNGDYQQSSNKLTFSNVLTTMQYCPDVNYDHEINQAIADGRSVHYTLKDTGSETYMYITDDSGKALLTLTRHNVQFMNGNWKVVAINGKEIDDDEANIFFDTTELKVHGNTGCNYFNGDIFIDPSAANSISFSGMAVTRMSCHKGDQERIMLVALEETASVTQDSDDSIVLLDNSGKQVLKLKRLPMGRRNE